MRYIIPIALSIAMLAAAQVQDLPKCAVQCFAKAIAATTCAATDPHCACTVGAAAFMKFAIPCLCEAGCSADDLKKVETATNNLCAAALSAKGEEYTSATLDPKVCQAVETGAAITASTTGSMSLTSVTATATATAMETITGTDTATASATATATATAVAAAGSMGGAGANGFMIEGVMVGMAVGGLILM